jgi:alpha-L-fucosidase
MWWDWKGTNPNPATVAFMNKFYPADWTYADFAAEFRAELYGKFTRIKYCFLLSHCHLILDPNEWADIFAASGAKYVTNISL